MLAGTLAGAASAAIRSTGASSQTLGPAITILLPDAAIAQPVYEIASEFEASYGVTLNIVAESVESAYPRLLDDAFSGRNQFDLSIVPMSTLGELVSYGLILPVDALHAGANVPVTDPGDELPAIRRLRSFGESRYVVPYDCDCQLLFYRRDLVNDPAHTKAYETEISQPLRVPETWDELQSIATYFQSIGIDGIAMHTRPGGQGMFHYLSLSAPYVIGPDNPLNYWFDPFTMEPLVDSPGHVAAAETYKLLVKLGPSEQVEWTLGDSWQHFLNGNAVFTFSWGDLIDLAVDLNSPIKGKIGTAPLPGTGTNTNQMTDADAETQELGLVGNTTGESWAGVVMASSELPESAYALLASMASVEKKRRYAARTTDGIDPGSLSQIPPESAPEGTGKIEDYLEHGFAEADAVEYLSAVYRNLTAPLQLPYLRIPGAMEYLVALDVRLGEFLTGQVTTAQEAMSILADDFRAITNKRGLDRQLELYRTSLGL
jgi:multiple sugar transport system substrate-binding protein